MGNRCCLQLKQVSSDGSDNKVEICGVDGVGRDNPGLVIGNQEFNHNINGPVIQDAESAISLDVVSRDELTLSVAAINDESDHVVNRYGDSEKAVNPVNPN
ncbi:hypothetical protein CAPTEDRAFT_194200 [Capitella teleta]|uniref:Uncharacterized protein n=1 Tax=Capitella teleta TaxID=283909 RepID=R7V9C8_CAPTE|nr:hypothetical protein CAPTEDRAFT_194200 [Capitella teleta]|eukprot:ELU12966.1 hypothetical protein CAPTEDRAFT_194200 [Capitella teleta]